MALKLITPPAEEPVTLTQAREHLRATSTEEDAKILALIMAAREHVEDYTRRRLITQTWELVLDEFPRELELPSPPLQSVTSIKYLDESDVEQTLGTSSYQVDADSEPGRVVLAPNAEWPDLSEKINAVRIRFVCGYGGAAAVPWAIRAAMLLIIGHLFEQREQVNVGNLVTEMPFGVDRLLAPYRMLRF